MLVPQASTEGLAEQYAAQQIVYLQHPVQVDFTWGQELGKKWDVSGGKPWDKSRQAGACMRGGAQLYGVSGV